MSKTAPGEETGCCPRFDPTPWQGSQIEFDDKLFVKDRVHSIFHVPLNFGGVMRRNMTKIEAAGACEQGAELMVLSDENSLWGADVYIAVAKEVPGTEHARLSGTFLTKAFDGPFKDIRKWMVQMRDYVAEQGKVMRKTLFYYTTCPKCARAQGHNWVVLLGQV